MSGDGGGDGGGAAGSGFVEARSAPDGERGDGSGGGYANLDGRQCESGGEDEAADQDCTRAKECENKNRHHLWQKSAPEDHVAQCRWRWP